MPARKFNTRRHQAPATLHYKTLRHWPQLKCALLLYIINPRH